MTGKVICQICHTASSFKNKQGDYYFEAVEFLKIEKQYDENSLALCPLCAAQYQYGKRTIDEEIIKSLQILYSTTNNKLSPIININLCSQEASIFINKNHLIDLQPVVEDLLSKQAVNDSKNGTKDVLIATPEECLIDLRTSLKKQNFEKGNNIQNNLTVCPICQAKVRVDRLEKHKKKVHENKSSSYIKHFNSGRLNQMSNKPKAGSLRKCKFCGSVAILGSDTCYSCSS